MLQSRYEVSINPNDRVLSNRQLRKLVVGFDVIVSLLTDQIDAPVMDAAGEKLKLIANYAVGFDNIDLVAAKDRDIFVTNTPGTLTEAVAEHTFALVLSVARRIVEADRFVRANKYKQWEPELMLGMQMKGKTLGVLGLGRIGGLVAQIAQGFGMNVIYYDLRRNKALEKKYSVSYHQLATVLAESDIISLHVPLLPSTRHLINEHNLKTMKETAIIINTARGPVIDESALVQSLSHKKIMGAGLDVFEREPHISRILERLPNVVLTPHIASATTEAREAMSEIVAKNVIAVLEKGKPLNPAS